MRDKFVLFLIVSNIRRMQNLWENSHNVSEAFFSQLKSYMWIYFFVCWQVQIHSVFLLTQTMKRLRIVSY